MLHDLDATLSKLLYEKGNLSKRDIDIVFEQPNRDWSSRLSRPALNLYAFDLRENVKLRNMERQVQRMDNNSSRITRPPRRYDMTYFVTAWARKIEDEKQLLWRALSVFVSTPVLRPEECEGAIRSHPFDIPFYAATPLEHNFNVFDLWGVLNNEMRAGFTLNTTLALDTLFAEQTPLVLEAFVRVGQAEAPQRAQQLSARDTEIRHSSEDQKEG